MQSRTFLRIEGDLVSLVTEVIDREVTLPDLLTELTTAQVAITPRLPTGCRFWIRSGTTDRSVFVVEQPPSRRTIEYHASRRSDSEPITYRLAAAVRRLRRLDATATRSRGWRRTSGPQPIALARRDAVLLDPAEHERRRDRLSRIGQGQRGQRRRTGRRADRRVLGEPLQPGSPAPSAAVQRWLPGLGVPLAAGSARRPVHAVRPLLADPPPGRGPDGRAGDHGPAGAAPDPGCRSARPRSGRRTRVEDGGEADALAS